MDMELLEQEISKIEASIDEYDEVDTVVMADSIQAIEEAGYKLEAIEPLLQLLERHPVAYFGDPGEIVHFIEGLGGDYEKYLLASVKRKPTVTTIWMINRCINAREDKKALIDVLKEIIKREDVEPYIKERAQDYIDFLPIPRIAPWN